MAMEFCLALEFKFFSQPQCPDTEMMTEALLSFILFSQKNPFESILQRIQQQLPGKSRHRSKVDVLHPLFFLELCDGVCGLLP